MGAISSYPKMSIKEGTQWAWHVHHEKLYELLYDHGGETGLAKRQNHIRRHKPAKERARRLRLLKVVQEQAVLTALNTAKQRARFPWGRRAVQAAIRALHNAECPKCPWNGLTIFPVKKKK